MRYLVTRPEPGASHTAASLRALGHDVIVDPMLTIAFTGDVPLVGDDVQAVLATSANALRAIAAHPGRDAIIGLPLYTVGTATAEAAEDAGFGIAITADGDVEALADLVADTLDPEDGALLYAAGRDRRGDLDGELAEEGFTVRLAELYRAEPAETLSPDTVEALRAGALDGVLVYSARTAAALVAAAERAGLAGALAAIPFFVISEAAAEPLRRLDTPRIAVAERPNAKGVLALVAPLADGPEPDGD